MAKTKKVTVPVVITTEDSWWMKIKKFFYRSETVFLAFVTSITGFVTTTVTGVLSYTDFSSIFTMLQSGLSFRKDQLMVMGAGALLLGITQYIARIRGTKAVDAQLLPKA